MSPVLPQYQNHIVTLQKVDSQISIPHEHRHDHPQ